MFKDWLMSREGEARDAGAHLRNTTYIHLTVHEGKHLQPRYQEHIPPSIELTLIVSLYRSLNKHERCAKGSFCAAYSFLPHALGWVSTLPRAACRTCERRAWTPRRSRSRTGTVCSHEIQASVTDCPYLRPDGPDDGMSWRPSTRFDSIMTPMMYWAVSPDWSC